MTNINMSSNYVDIYYIDVSFTPSIDDLIKDNVILTVNDNTFFNFNLDKLNPDGSLYRIFPYLPFNIYDEVRILINKPDYKVNALKIYIAKYFYNSGGIFLYTLPNVSSGVYHLKITKINGEDFLLTSDPIIVCNGINPSMSYINSDKSLYNIGETVNLGVSLFDTDNFTVPDGKYVIKLKIEKI